ncbi:hypothetical protein BH11BAC1_BH11BAC1_24770 [soil metagenome]
MRVDSTDAAFEFVESGHWLIASGYWLLATGCSISNSQIPIEHNSFIYCREVSLAMASNASPSTVYPPEDGLAFGDLSTVFCLLAATCFTSSPHQQN